MIWLLYVKVLLNGKKTVNELKHVAIIMDGNGRWATKRNKERSFGHHEGAKNVRTITQHASDIGIQFLTLYAFSTENWNRPKSEVTILMNLLSEFLKSEITMLLNNNIRFDVIGDISKFSIDLQRSIQKTKMATQNCTGMTQVIAINYGAHDEIIRAVNRAVSFHPVITKELFESYLDTAYMPPVDLLIRTGGDSRLSNFLLWQAAYAELFFTQTLWPDFTKDELLSIISKYHKTQRKFGNIVEVT